MTAAAIDSSRSVPPRGGNDTGKGGNTPGDGESSHLDARNLDAGPPRGLVVVADGVEEQPELGLLEDVAADSEQDREDKHHQRDALMGVQDSDDDDAQHSRRSDRNHHALQQRGFKPFLLAAGNF
jgi:hypothetical protein